MKKPNWQYFELEEYTSRGSMHFGGRMEGLGVDAVLVNTPENLLLPLGLSDAGVLLVADAGGADGPGASVGHA